jgi:ATP phosphoribosyltransferase regulatory subunit
LLAEKNEHDTRALCESYGVDGGKLFAIVKTYGSMDEVLARLAPLCKNGKSKEAYDELALVCGMLSKTEYADKIRLDFSVVNDMNYYSDIVFKGFIDGVAEGVLSGGRYDKMMSRLGKDMGAIGFAVYLDLLEGFDEEKSATDVDVVVLYDEKTSISQMVKTVERLVKKGYLVSVQTSESALRYKDTVDLRGCKR